MTGPAAVATIGGTAADLNTQVAAQMQAVAATAKRSVAVRHCAAGQPYRCDNCRTYQT